MDKSHFYISAVCLFAIASCVKDSSQFPQEIIPVEIAQETAGNQTSQNGAGCDDNPSSAPATGHLKFGIIGDSISTFDGYLPSDVDGYEGAVYKTYYPKGNVNKVEKTWWYKTATMLGSDIGDICNCSWSGSTVSGNSLSEANAYAGCSTRRIQDLSVRGFIPDIVLCFISCNDWAANVPVGSWSFSDPLVGTEKVRTLREAYAIMIQKIHLQYPAAIVFCLTNLIDKNRDIVPGWPSTNDNKVTTEEWNKNIVEIANALHCHVVDLQSCGIDYDNIRGYTVDGGLHPNNAGMTLIANAVATKVAEVLHLDIEI